MIKRKGNGSFEKLPNIRDTVINGNLLLTLHENRSAKPDLKIGYEQAKESKIYKRTRLNDGSPRQMKKWPASLLLSGRKVFDSIDIPPSESLEADIDKSSESENGMLPPIDSERIVLLEPSKSFYNDFGLRTQNTDTFSGYRNMKMKKNKSTSFVEREIEKKAMKHIHAIQVLSSSKRGSYAIRSVNSLKETLGPMRSNTEVMLPTSYVRSQVVSEKHPTFVDVTKKPPYNMLVRTRDGNTTSKVSRGNNPLPEISGRTLLGFETKLSGHPSFKECS